MIKFKEKRKMPKNKKIINEELRELIEDHKDSKYWKKPIHSRKKRREGFYKNQEEKFDKQIARGICELECYETEIKITKAKENTIIRILAPIYYEPSEPSDIEEEIEICKGVSAIEDLQVYEWLMNAEEYIKAARYLERKKSKNEEKEQTKENTKIIITNKASIKYILNEQ